MQRDVKAVLDGSVGGVIGTALMSATMMAGKRLGLLGEHPPELLAAAMLRGSRVPTMKGQTQDALAVAAHFAFGIGAGALFAVLHRRLRLPIHAAIHGALYGTGVWAVSYIGWIPALGIMPSADHDRPGRPLVMVLAHWIFGGVLGSWVGRSDKHR